MKVELIRNEKGKEPSIEIIDLDGNTIMPYRLSVASIDHTPDGLKLHITREYTTKISYDIEGDRLWIMGGKDAIDEQSML